MLRNMSTSLFDKEQITTTLSKAKELRPFAERLLTLAKRETLHARRQVLRHIHDRKVVAKLFDTLSARYAQRPGGYTRILKLGPRRGDAAEMAIIELVGGEHDTLEQPAEPKAKKGRRAKAAAATAPAPKKKSSKKKKTKAKTAAATTTKQATAKTTKKKQSKSAKKAGSKKAGSKSS